MCICVRRPFLGHDAPPLPQMNTRSQMEYEAPNPRIHFFTGTLTVGGGGNGEGGAASGRRDVPVDQSNLLLRGSRLRNTKWVLGIVTYTGKESKIAQNARNPPSKQSNLDKVTFLCRVCHVSCAMYCWVFIMVVLIDWLICFHQSFFCCC